MPEKSTIAAPPMQTAQQIRTRFLEYFTTLPGHPHLELPSAPLVPRDDPTILLINAGMTPLKKYFTGEEAPPSPRMAGVQKCVRTLDIDQVGRTSRHCTFFEMLGNFSIGDYFKAEIIPWAWTFLTEHLQIPIERLKVSVHETDAEAYAIWRDGVGLPAERVVKLGDDDNFWFMADTGPCGPDSEIFYDLGPAHGSTDGSYDGPGSKFDRWIEIWNLVFTQFNRDAQGVLHELPKKNVDTGSGLERMCVVLQGKATVFETDGFQPLLAYFREKTRVPFEGGHVNPYYVLADHLRATSFLIADGVYPDRMGRGYVLRRIMRRALRYGATLGFEPGDWFGAFPLLKGLMVAQYPEIGARESVIRERVEAEETTFLRTLHRGETLLQKTLDDLRDAHGGTLPAVFPGEEAFELQDTYGFPLELTADIVEEQGMTVDRAAYDASLGEQRKRSKADTLAKLKSAGAGGEGSGAASAFAGFPATIFTGYSGAMDEETELLGAVAVGEDGAVLVALERTPFYAESGGQIGDRGTIRAADGSFVLEVLDTQKGEGGVVLHRAKLTSGTLELLEPQTPIHAEVDPLRRKPTMRAHSSAHLLHSALKQVLGAHVEQAGSLVEPDRVRFDFKHFQAMTPEEIKRVDLLVNAWILEDFPVEKMEKPIAEAKAMGAVAMFGEKYGERVRIIRMGPASLEFCGGTHLDHTGQIGSFVLVKEESIASGTRRVSGYTGQRAVEYLLEQESTVATLAGEMKTKREVEALLAAVQKLRDEQKTLRDQLAQAQAEAAAGQVGALLDGAQTLGGVTVLAANVPGVAIEGLRTMRERIAAAHPAHAILLIGGEEGKLGTLVSCSPEAIAKGLKAGDLIGAIGKHLGAGGGGRPDVAQGGGKDATRVPEALELFRASARQALRG